MFSFGIDVSRMHGNICDTHHVSDVSELKQRPTKVYSMAREKVWSIIVDDIMIQWMSGTNVSGHVFMPRRAL